MPIWSTQPLKALYGLFFLAKVLILLPVSLIRFTPKTQRPTPSTPLRICVVNAICRELFKYYTATRSTGVASVTSGHKKAKERYALASPGAASLYTGILTPGTTKPEAVGGIWYPSPLTKNAENIENEKIVLHVPGGAFVLAFGTEENGVEISKVMSQHLKASRTFVAQYRVSTNEETRFPAAIQDLVTVYAYILSLGVKSENVVVSGDSAAGNLVLGLLRYIESESVDLPCPGGAMLWSPWVHVTHSAGKDYASSANASSDLLTPSLLQWGADAYLPTPKPASEQLPYVSPLHHPFQTSVPVYIHAGGAEGFFAQISEFAKEMSGVKGNKIRFHATELAPHNLLMAFKGLGLDGEMEGAAEDAWRFFEEGE
jgi:acetyl esterase/lipase